MMMEFIRTAKVHNVRVLDRFLSNGGRQNSSDDSVGSLFLTPTHLIFTDMEGKYDIWILHSMVASIRKLPTGTDGTPIRLRCKDFRYITFAIPRENEAHELYTTIMQISLPSALNDLFCFHYIPTNEEVGDDKTKGWKKFNLRREYQRMGIPNEDWIITNANKEYTLCCTYPPYLVVPSSIDEQTLIESATFRSKCRIPVLTYFHPNGASITRSSQPLPGLSNQRCAADERLLRAILAANKGSKCLNIVDTRPMINAIANKAAGKGYEYSHYYRKIKRHFYAIENIHVMRSSLEKLTDACETKIFSITPFLNALESCGWLRHVSSILEAALFIATSIRDGISVMVHCSDGWDRTAQTCALASLILDPYYRTIDGFEALIEKDWLAFGHRFSTRCGHFNGNDSRQVAPVFTQFIDCVWQVTQQFPHDFEFNEKFLLTMNDHAYSCQYGTFVGDCDKDREEYLVKVNTHSLWAIFDVDRTEYTNPLYIIQKKKKALRDFLDVSTAPQVMRFWRSMYNRYDTGIHPRESFDDLMFVTVEHIRSLEDHIIYLEEKITEQEELSKTKCALKKQESQKGPENGEENNYNMVPSLSHDDSFDSISSPLRVVQECMIRLQLQQDIREKERASSKASNGQDSDQESKCEGENVAKECTEDTIAKEIVAPCEDLDVIDDESFNELFVAVKTVALDWQSVRNVRECKSCQVAFDSCYIKYHCWCCGKVFCIRCIKKKTILPGHKYTQNPTKLSQGSDLCDSSSQASFKSSTSLLGPLFGDDRLIKKVPVCLGCFKSITTGQSLDFNN